MTRAPAADPRVATCLRFLRVAGDVLTASDTCLSRVGLSQSRFGVLFQLARAAAEGLTPSELAERVGVPRATMTGLLDSLQAEGLVQRIPSARDRRSLSVQLTPRGQEFVEREVPSHCGRMSEMMSALDEAERALLDRVLDKLEAAVGGMRP